MLRLLITPVAYLLICAITSALLAYPLHLVRPGAVSFHTLVSKGALLILILGLIPIGRRLAIGKAQMGIATSSGTLYRQLRHGFFWGALMLGVHVLILLGLDIRVIDQDKLAIMRATRLAAKALLIGLVVASLEEAVFRGFLLGYLTRKTSQTKAVLITSFYFAALHFLRSDIRPEAHEVQWDTAFMIIADSFRHLSQIPLDAFLALFSAGAFLAYVRLYFPPAGLGYCIGLHAGWVFVIKTAKPLTNRGAHPFWADLVANYDGIIGHLSTAWMTVLIFILLGSIHRQAKPYPPIDR